MTLPVDHECECRERAAAVEARIAALERMVFGNKSEKQRNRPTTRAFPA